eukprot:scaffold8287_cov36-Tisochrysis_lutea.AAC.4
MFPWRSVAAVAQCQWCCKPVKKFSHAQGGSGYMLWGGSTNFIVSCHGARRRSPPLLWAPRRGQPQLGGSSWRGRFGDSGMSMKPSSIAARAATARAGGGARSMTLSF